MSTALISTPWSLVSSSSPSPNHLRTNLRMIACATLVTLTQVLISNSNWFVCGSFWIYRKRLSQCLTLSTAGLVHPVKCKSVSGDLLMSVSPGPPQLTPSPAYLVHICLFRLEGYTWSRGGKLTNKLSVQKYTLSLSLFHI